MLSPRLIIFTLVGTLFYIGIAILGWGGFSAFFSHPARIAATIVLFAMAFAGLFSGANMSTGDQEDRGNRWVIAALGVTGLLSAYLPAYAERMEFLDLWRRYRPVDRRRCSRRWRRGAHLAYLYPWQPI